MNNNMNKNMKVNRNRPAPRKNKNDLLKYILFGAAAVLLIAVIVIIIVVSAQSCNAQPSNPADGEFTEVNEKAYIYSDQNDDGKCDGKCDKEGESKAQATLYLQPSKTGTTITLTCGTEITRTGILIEDEKNGYGWSRVEYNGKEYYIRNSCVTTVKPHSEAASGSNSDEAVG